MKIIQINSDFRKGSTGKITADLHDTLKSKGFQSIVIYGRANEKLEVDTYSVISERKSKFEHALCLISGDKYGWCHNSTKKVIDIIKRKQPDIVHLQCINGYFVNIYRLLAWLGKNNVKTVLTIHAEFMYTGGCDHAFECEEWKRKCKNCNLHHKIKGIKFPVKTAYIYENFKKAYGTFSNNMLKIVSVSPWMGERAKSSPLLCDFKHYIIGNGVDTSVFYYRGNLNKYDNRKKALFVSASFTNKIDDNKGGLFVIKLAQMLSNIDFYVVATFVDVNVTLPTNIKMIGRISDQDKLAEMYSAADVTIVTSKRESFSMPTAESLCCGTPVVGFCAGGPETIGLKDYTKFVDYGDLEMLKEAILYFSHKNGDKHTISVKGQQTYSKEVMFKKYMDIYKSF